MKQRTGKKAKHAQSQPNPTSIIALVPQWKKVLQPSKTMEDSTMKIFTHIVAKAYTWVNCMQEKLCWLGENDQEMLKMIQIQHKRIVLHTMLTSNCKWMLFYSNP